jgi:4-amino-4-deoxy-L-arabinose transferase-like glycosyltransferase
LLLGAAIVLRLALLWTSERLLDGDEAVVGVMARHVAYQHELPLFFWGQPYGGGAAIEAYLAAIPFLLFGPNGIALKAVPLAFTIASWILAYALVRRCAGEAAALAATALLAFGTPALEVSLKGRGGYAELPFFILLALTLFERLPSGRRYAAALGLTCGIAYYSQELILPFLLVLGIAVLWSRRHVAVVAAGAVIGLLPLLAYNATHHWANIDYIWRHGAQWHASAAHAWYALTFAAPALFQPHNIDGYPPALFENAYLEAVLYALLFVLWAAQRNARRHAVESVLAAHVVLHTALFALSEWSAMSPRYLFPIFPSLAILGGIAVVRARLPQAVRVALALAPPLLGIATAALSVGLPFVVDDVHTRGGARIEADVAEDSLPRAMAILQAAHVTRVRTTYFTQWRLIFESGERVIASSGGLDPGALRYPPFDREVAREHRPAIILHKLSYANADLRRRGLRPINAGDYWVYLPQE